MSRIMSATLASKYGHESVPFHEYEVYRVTESGIVPGAKARMPIGWRCPRCQHENLRVLEHDDVDRCENCRLGVRLRGNGLIMWR